MSSFGPEQIQPQALSVENFVQENNQPRHLQPRTPFGSILSAGQITNTTEVAC